MMSFGEPLGAKSAYQADHTSAGIPSRLLTVLGGLAEFERDLIRARTSEGRARAVANAGDRGVDAARLGDRGLVDRGRRQLTQFALELQKVGDLRTALPYFVHQQDADRPPSLQVEVRLNAELRSSLVNLLRQRLQQFY
jgi:hypothetical protein